MSTTAPSPSPRSLPSRWVAGHPVRWAIDLGVLGAIVPMAPLFGASAYAGWAMGPATTTGLIGEWMGAFVVLGLVSGVGWAAVAAATPWVLQRVRGQVPLPLLTLLAATLAATVTFGAGWLCNAFLGTGLGPMIALSAAVAGVMAGVAWLPYTVASVLRARTWPVVAGAVALSVPLSAAMYAALLVAV